MKNKKIDTSNLKENLQNPRTKGLMFFGFYFIFFIVLFIMLGSSQDNNLNGNEQSTTDINFQFNLINKQNYHFQYKIEEDNITTVFEGDKNTTKENVMKTINEEQTEYFNQDGIFLEKKENDWVLSSTPYLFSEFLDVKEINRFVKNSTFISKTEFSNQEVCYQYQISTTTLVSLLEEKDIDLGDEANVISLYVKNNEVYKIELALSPYIEYKMQTKKTLKMTLEYSAFNTIKDLKTPEYKIES